MYFICIYGKKYKMRKYVHTMFQKDSSYNNIIHLYMHHVINDLINTIKVQIMFLHLLKKT